MIHDKRDALGVTDCPAGCPAGAFLFEHDHETPYGLTGQLVECEHDGPMLVVADGVVVHPDTLEPLTDAARTDQRVLAALVAETVDVAEHVTRKAAQ